VAARQIDLYDKQRRLAWYLIIPAVLVVVLVIGYPLAQVVVYSFLKYKLDGVTPASFVGIDNYAFVLSDPDWWRAVWNTLIFTFFSVTLETILGLVVALVANAKFKGRTFFRIAILIPWAIPTVVSSQIWKWMFNDVYGVVNLLLTNFHIIPEKIAWLAVPETAIPVIIAVDVWKTVPFMALLILAGLQTIPGVKEAGAASLLAELGPAMNVFGSADKLSSWSGVAPGNNQSAGTKKRAPALRGNPWVRATLTEAAWSASRKKESEFRSEYERLKPRLQHKRAIVAVAHSLAETVFEVLRTGEPYTRPGSTPMPETKTIFSRGMFSSGISFCVCASTE
jgi:ABC-type spermidine/putrescine transport system permease subunit II